MWKWMTFVLVALFGPLSSAALACGQPLPPEPTKTPIHESMVSVATTTVVKLQGKPIALRCVVAGATNLGVDIGDQVVWIDIRGNKSWSKVFFESLSARVVVEGELVDNVVRVVSLKPAVSNETYLRKTVRVELRGVLVNDPREILRTHGVHWRVTVDGVDYFLHFQDPETSKRLSKLAGRHVVVFGQIEPDDRWTIVRLREVREAVGPAFEIRFSRSAGLPDFRHISEVAFLSSRLTKERCEELRRLIEESDFLDLRSSLDSPIVLPDPPAVNYLTLVIGDTTHRVGITDLDLSPSARKLVDFLLQLRTEEFAKRLVGMAHEDALRIAGEQGIVVRLAGKDGESFPLTTDLQPNRITIWVKKGKVVSATAE